MRICLQCQQPLLSETWKCPSCQYQPPAEDGIPLFAPDLSKAHPGFPPERYPLLSELESGNFWFRSRNKLILWVLNRHFKHMKNFLEVGCGTGFVLTGIASAFPKARLSASEIDSAGLRFVRENVPDANLYQMDARSIPFRDEFDVIGAFDVIEHVEEDEALLNQIHHACGSGGGVIITVPQHPGLWSEVDAFSHHKRRYTQQELTRKMGNAGFEIVEIISFVSLLLPILLLSRLKSKSNKEFDSMREFAIPRFLNGILKIVMDIERMFIRTGLRLPVGGSLLCVGKKRKS